MRIVLAVVLVTAFLLPLARVPAQRAVVVNGVSFAATWERTDRPVDSGRVKRTWMWGPAPLSGAFEERYADSPNGKRAVQYFDKSRMEITHPDGDPTSPWYVTNGLLVVELVTGRMQIGDREYEDRSPAAINVAGDPDDPNGPTYATFAAVTDIAARTEKEPITERLARSGLVTDDASLAGQGVFAARYVPQTDHVVASVFWDFMNALGIVEEGGRYVPSRLFLNPFYATGFPISGAYWTDVRVAGSVRTVLVQCFERRCLTWTPDNPEGWNVETGNVGQHYYQWRYNRDVLQPQDEYRATLAWDAMQQHFADPDRHLYRETAGADALAFHWPFSQALAAAQDLADLPGVGDPYRAEVLRLFEGSNNYWSERAPRPAYASAVVPPLGPGGDIFFDDNAWTAMELVRIYRLSGDVSALERARTIFDFIIGGWDSDNSHPSPGGVFWVDADWNRDRNTVSNAPSTELGLMLADLARDDAERQYYQDWSIRMYAWVDTNLRAENGLYWDHVDLQGNVDRAQWSYNQGTMIGASVMLFEATQDEAYLLRAQEIARVALSHFTPEELDRNDIAFNAIFFRNLLLLHHVANNPAYVDAMQAYADRLWDARLDPDTNLLTSSQPLTLLDQAGLVQLYAMLAGV